MNGTEIPTWTPELGNRLSQVISRLGGLRSASAIAGVSDEQLARWRDGKSKPNFFGVMALANQAWVRLEWVATGEEPMLREKESAEERVDAIDAVSLGERFKAIRAHLGLNATEMAQKVELGGRSSWERYERGKHIPNGEILLHLAEMGFDTNWLLTGKGQMRPSEDAPKPPAGGIDRDLLAAIHKGVAEVYRSENARISADPLADEVARIYDDLAATYDSPGERLSALKLALHQLRRELQTPTGGASRKQVS